MLLLDEFSSPQIVSIEICVYCVAFLILFFADVIEESPVSLPNVKPPPDKPNPKMGVGLLSWSSDSRLILSRNLENQMRSIFN